MDAPLQAQLRRRQVATCPPRWRPCCRLFLSNSAVQAGKKTARQFPGDLAQARPASIFLTSPRGAQQRGSKPLADTVLTSQPNTESLMRDFADEYVTSALSITRLRHKEERAQLPPGEGTRPD